jgi:hypothetical protein
MPRGTETAKAVTPAEEIAILRDWQKRLDEWRVALRNLLGATDGVCPVCDYDVEFERRHATEEHMSFTDCALFGEHNSPGDICPSAEAERLIWGDMIAHPRYHAPWRIQENSRDDAT